LFTKVCDTQHFPTVKYMCSVQVALSISFMNMKPTNKNMSKFYYLVFFLLNIILLNMMLVKICTFKVQLESLKVAYKLCHHNSNLDKKYDILPLHNLTHPVFSRHKRHTHGLAMKLQILQMLVTHLMQILQTKYFLMSSRALAGNPHRTDQSEEHSRCCHLEP